MRLSLLAGNRNEPLPECILIFMIEGDCIPEGHPAHQVFEFLQTPTKDTDQCSQILHPSAPKLHSIEFAKLVSSRSPEDLTFKGWVEFLLPQSTAEWEQIAGESDMFSDLKKKVERYSADDKLAMQQRSIDERRVAQTLALGAALRSRDL